MFKKVVCALIFLSIVGSGCTKDESTIDDLSTIKDRGQLIVGVKIDTRPFGFLNSNNKNVGFDIDLAKYLTKKLLGDENKVVFVPVNAANRILKLASSEVDIVIATMSVTPQRHEILDFSIPYHVAGEAIMVNSGSKITSLRELKGKKVIIVYGSTVERNLRTNVPNIKIIGYRTYPDAYEALRAGKADAMIADDTILLGFALNNPSVKILSRRYSKEPYAVAFRKGQESEMLREIIDIELKDAVKNGTLKQLKAKWEVN